MEATLSKVWYQEEERRIVATVRYSEEQPDGTVNDVTVGVFLPWIDSYDELKRQAFAKAKSFVSQVISSA